MSKTYIPSDLRRIVIERAQGLCEYCLIHEDDTHFGCQIDHIISEKHGGETTTINLAYACIFCNRNKGSDIGSIIWETNAFVRFFNPRIDEWKKHFELSGVEILPKTAVGEVTTRILEMNSIARLIERQVLRKIGRYPSPPALFVIQ